MCAPAGSQILVYDVKTAHASTHEPCCNFSEQAPAMAVIFISQTSHHTLSMMGRPAVPPYLITFKIVWTQHLSLGMLAPTFRCGMFTFFLKRTHLKPCPFQDLMPPHLSWNALTTARCAPSHHACAAGTCSSHQITGDQLLCMLGETGVLI